MKFAERVTGIFMKPEDTMKDIIKEPRIEEALVIVGVYAILYMLYEYFVTTRMDIIYDFPGLENSSGLKTIMMVFTLVFGLIMPFILWLIIAGLLHLIAMAFGGSGKFFPNFMAGIGYSQIVKIITIIIAILLMTQVPVFTFHISQSNPMAAVDTAKQLHTNIFYTLCQIVLLIGVIVSSILGFFAVKDGEKLTTTQAALVVGIPLVIYLAFTIYTSFL